MKYLKLFESFYDLEITEDYILEFIEDGDCWIPFKNEWIAVYRFERNWEKAAAKLNRMSDRGDHYAVELHDAKWIVIFHPELGEFLDSKLLDCEILPSKLNKDILIWKKDGEVVANQDLENDRFWVKWEGIWKVFRAKYSMDEIAIEGFIAGWLEERYKLGSFTPNFGFLTGQVFEALTLVGLRNC